MTRGRPRPHRNVSSSKHDIPAQSVAEPGPRRRARTTSSAPTADVTRREGQPAASVPGNQPETPAVQPENVLFHTPFVQPAAPDGVSGPPAHMAQRAPVEQTVAQPLLATSAMPSYGAVGGIGTSAFATMPHVAQAIPNSNGSGDKTKGQRDTLDDLPNMSGHSGEDSKSKQDRIKAVLRRKADELMVKFPNGSKDEQSSKTQLFDPSSPETDANKGRYFSLTSVKNKEDQPSKELPSSDCTAAVHPIEYPEPRDKPLSPGLAIGSIVEVPGVPRGEMSYGVIRWIGSPEGSKSTQPVAGIELESAIAHGTTDGTFNQVRYFQCDPRRALFVYLSKCKLDSRIPSREQSLQSWKHKISQAAAKNDEDQQSKELSSNSTAAAPPIDNNEPPDEPLFPVLEVNSMVEFPGMRGEEMRYGVIRWIGYPEGSKSTQPVAGIELTSATAHRAKDGIWNKIRYFQCEPHRAVFVYLSKCKPDSRFPSEAQTFQSIKRQTSQDFGGFKSPLVKGFINPPKSLQASFVGMGKGIQGEQNSCYLDTTLFSMFAYNGVFDPLLRRSKGEGDLELYEEVQKMLRESIVNPLRKHGFVGADCVLQLRKHLDHLGTTKGLMSEEKDPEEFLHTLLSEVFKSKPLLRKRHGNSTTVDASNIYQIIMDKDESLKLPTVEQLLLQSFQEQNLKLVEAPSCLIVQMPRSGIAFKMYKHILPSLQLDITSIIERYPRQSCVSGNLAVYECDLCKYDKAVADTTLIKNYCKVCFETMHNPSKRLDHKPTELNNPDRIVKEFFSKTPAMGYTEQEVDRHRQSLLRPKLMDLFAVICIHTSHYVAFVKAGRAADSEWVFFDSMPDRQGDPQGFNIPQITHLKDFWRWVDKESFQHKIQHDQLTDMMERLMGDAYICMYSDTDMNKSA